jgi:hypothetical protein
VLYFQKLLLEAVILAKEVKKINAGSSYFDSRKKYLQKFDTDPRDVSVKFTGVLKEPENLLSNIKKV